MTAVARLLRQVGIQPKGRKDSQISRPRPRERASGTNWSLSGSTATLDALPLPGIDPRFLCCLARSLVTILTELELNTCFSHFNTIIRKRLMFVILCLWRLGSVRISNSYE